MDPWSWRTHMVPLTVMPLLQFLETKVRSGITDPRSLVDFLTELPELSSALEEAGPARVRESLMLWAEIAVNLYSDRR